MRKLVLLLVAAVTLSWVPVPAEAKLEMRNPCADGMVLQQKSDASIFGISDPGATVEVIPSWDGAVYRCVADKDGLWEVKVATPAAGYTPYWIQVSNGSETLMISDVLIGEVWLASGQSNMEMPVGGFDNCPVEGYLETVMAAPAHDKIRMFCMPKLQSYTPEIQAPGEWLKADPNTIARMSAAGYYFARKLNEVLDVPVGIVACAYGGARVESWLPEEVLRAYGTEDLTRERMEKMIHYHRPFLMYNAMMHPVMGYTIKGFIWYQGCSNVGFEQQFVARMSDMVRIFREGFGDTEGVLPFYQVEIAPYVYDSRRSDDESQAALLREAQHACDAMIPNLATVVTNDLVYPYEKNNIHPSQKRQVGERLAALALNRDYGFSGVKCYSPSAVEVFREKGRTGEICVRLADAEKSLNRTSGIETLEVRAADGPWVPVSNVRFSGDVMRISCPEVPEPAEVRYGWGDFRPGNLAGRYGLPLVPFWMKLEKQNN